MPKFFVWLSSQTGPQPQIWHDDEPKNGEGKAKHEPLKKIELTSAESMLPLSALVQIYPAPQ